MAVVVAGAWELGTTTGEATEQDPPLAERGAQLGSEPETRAGYLVARFSEGARPRQVSRLLRSLDVTSETVHPASDLHRIKLDPGTNAEHVAAVLEGSSLVDEVGPSHVAQLHDAPNDTNYAYQWHMHNTVGGMWAESAWAAAPNRGADVVVAVIDTGVAYEDFTGPGPLGPQTYAQAQDLPARHSSRPRTTTTSTAMRTTTTGTAAT